jgi:hypothetical protein
LQNRWEIAFFLVLYCLLTLQVLLFYNEIQDLSSIGRAIAAFAAFESFVVHRVFYVVTPATLLPLLCLLLLKQRPSWARKYLDVLGVYAIFRMVVQLIGLNILVFDVLTSRFLLITQLLFFLPYSLLIWGVDLLETGLHRQKQQPTIIPLGLRERLPEATGLFCCLFLLRFFRFY